MPLDGVKSVVYRSFITCDDPKGVVDCSIIRKSKVNSQRMEQKIKTHRTSRNPNKALVSKVEKEEPITKGKSKRFHSQSPLPLVEVYRGNEKLNQMFDSWSKGVRSDRKSEDIAEDLLEGTSSLKESLIMLAKLQEASNQSVQLKMKYQRSVSCHLEEQSFPVEVQRSKLSRYGSSTDGADEIKKVIKDSLVRRDVACDATVGEKSCFRDINSDSRLEITSTSSSQSSMANDNVDCCHVSTSVQRNLKGSNLIAKLMGLEEISSRPEQTTLKKEFEFTKISGYRRSLFRIDTLNAPKSKSVVDKKDSEKGTLREILETMPFNRLTESDSDIEFKLHNNGSKQRLKDVPPIVLIKPMPLPSNELEEHRARVSLKEEAFNQKAILRKMKKKELCWSFDDSDLHGGILSSDKFHRKQAAERIPLKQIAQEERIPKRKEEVWKLRKGDVDTNKKDAEKLKPSSIMHDKKVLTSKKVTAATRKPVKKEFVAKEKVVSRSQHQEKVTSTNPRKNRTHKKCSSISDSVSGRAVRTTSIDCDCRKKEKPVLARSEAKSLTRIVEAKEDDRSTDTNENVELPKSKNRNTSTLMALITMEEETDECDTKIIECCKESPNSLSPLSPKLEIDTSTEEVIDLHLNTRTETDTKSCNQGTNLKALFLRSSSFLSQAEELFDLKLNGRTMLHTSCCNDPKTPNAKHLIDCAIELMKRKCHPDIQVCNSLFLGYRSNTKIEISVEKLVEEVCDDIDTLTSYQTIRGIDTLHAVLERDVWCKEVSNGMWDLGWKNGFSRSESEEVVNDIEKLILNGLIEESFI